MSDKVEFKVTDEWAEDFAKREGISFRQAKFTLKLVVGWDNFLYNLSCLFRRSK